MLDWIRFQAQLRKEVTLQIHVVDSYRVWLFADGDGGCKSLADLWKKIRSFFNLKTSFATICIEHKPYSNDSSSRKLFNLWDQHVKQVQSNTLGSFVSHFSPKCSFINHTITVCHLWYDFCSIVSQLTGFSNPQIPAASTHAKPLFVDDMSLKLLFDPYNFWRQHLLYYPIQFPELTQRLNQFSDSYEVNIIKFVFAAFSFCCWSEVETCGKWSYDFAFMMTIFTFLKR